MKLRSILLASALFGSTLFATAAVETTPVKNAPAPKVAVIEAPGALSGTSTIITTATVQKIDKKTREITLKKEDGEIIKITAPAEVRNFAQIKVKDVVTTQLNSTIDIRLIKGASSEVAYAVQESSSRAKLGDKPSATATRMVAARSKVTKVDATTQMITLEGQNGTSEIMVKNPDQFKLIVVGDMVDTVATQTVAMSVATPKKK
jgi:Cu/Ag efflux protein CusF